MSSFGTINLLDIIEDAGTESAQAALDAYACPLNPDIEQYVSKRAVDFSLQGIAQTHLVYRLEEGMAHLVGFFTLTNKVLTIREGEVSKSLFKRFRRFGLYDEGIGAAIVAMPLIAQLGKNYADGCDLLISGEALLGMACDKVKEIQRELGGKLTYLECEDVPALVRFYEGNGFRRVSPSAGAGELLQLVRQS